MFTKLTVKTGEFGANVSFGDVSEFVPPNSVREFEGAGDVTYQVDELEEGQTPHVDLPFTPPPHNQEGTEA